MKKYRKPTMEIITICNEELLAALSAHDNFNDEDVSYSKRRGFILEDDEE